MGWQGDVKSVCLLEEASFAADIGVSLQNRGRGLSLPLLICALCHFVASSEVLSSAWLFLGSSLLLYRASDGRKLNDFQ